MMRKNLFVAALLMAAVPVTARAQGKGLVGACAEVEDSLRQACSVAAQAAEAAQPQVGILVTGGNPTIGTASTGGLRLGVLPRVSATVKANVVRARIPDLREVRVGSTDDVTFGDRSILAPSLSATATVGVFSGLTLAPTIGGIGSIDLLGSASWLPLNVLGSDEIRESSEDLAYGGGIRLGLLRESFTMPGASVSLTYHRLGTVALGEICPTRLATSETTGPGYTLEQGQCAPTDLGDMGEFRFDLSSWSARAAVSKHLLGLGLTGGIGYDRHASDIAAGVRAPQVDAPGPRLDYARITDVELSQARWSAFVNGSFSVLVATFAAELGWLHGSDPLTGFPESASKFEPEDGSFFGSVGVRVAL